jgi:hypothetical protein
MSSVATDIRPATSPRVPAPAPLSPALATLAVFDAVRAAHTRLLAEPASPDAAEAFRSIRREAAHEISKLPRKRTRGISVKPPAPSSVRSPSLVCRIPPPRQTTSLSPASCMPPHLRDREFWPPCCWFPHGNGQLLRFWPTYRTICGETSPPGCSPRPRAFANRDRRKLLPPTR